MKNSLLIIFFSSFLQILGIFIVTFLILHLLPGDPIQVMLGESASLADKVKIRSELGLDQPIYEQMANSFFQIIEGIKINICISDNIATEVLQRDTRPGVALTNFWQTKSTPAEYAVEEESLGGPFILHPPKTWWY